MKGRDMKKEMIYWGALLDRKGFAAARSGNISCKAESGRIWVTAHNAYLGRLEEEEILLMDPEGNILKGELPLTAEKDLHLSVHRKFPDTGVVVHAHPPYTTALFHYFGRINFFSSEAEFYLGGIEAVPQATPAISDVEPVLRALEKSNIVVLKNHGVVSRGSDFKEAAGAIELLEEQARVDLLMQSLGVSVPEGMAGAGGPGVARPGGNKTYACLSEEHVARLVSLVNDDDKARRLGEKYNLALTLAMQNQDTGDVVRFHCEKGRITGTDNVPQADFLFVEKGAVLKKLFNREMDPMTVLARRRVGTAGDVSGIMEWYPLLVRIFKLWGEARVE